MKILRFVGILLLLIIVAIVILGLVAPKDLKVERAVTINAPQAVVADQMFYFHNFKNWSPFQELDPNMQTTVTGQDGQPGSVYSWKGEGNAGEGSMTNISRTSTKVKLNLNFIKPWESTPTAVWRAEDIGNNQTKATWSMSMHSPFPWNGLGMIMGMKKGLEKEFDKGLNNLKALAESNKSAAASSGNFNIIETQFAGGTYAGIRKTIAITEIEKFFSDSYETISKAAGNRINGKASGLFYKWDEANGKADAAAVFPVSGTEPVANALMINVPASKAYMIEYKGGYAGSYAAHTALTKDIEAKGKKPDLVVEEYMVNPGDTKDSNAYVTNIYYLVK